MVHHMSLSKILMHVLKTLALALLEQYINHTPNHIKLVPYMLQLKVVVGDTRLPVIFISIYTVLSSLGIRYIKYDADT